MGTSKHGFSDWESRAKKSQEKSSRHEPGQFEFMCDLCSGVFSQSELKLQHGKRCCAGCYEPAGDAIDRDLRRAMASKYAAQRDAQRRLPKEPYSLESAPWIIEFTPSPIILTKPDIFGNPGTGGTLVIDGGRLNEVEFLFPLGVIVVDVTYSADYSTATFTLDIDDVAFAGEFPIYADGEKFSSKVMILEDPVDPDITYLRLDGTNNGTPLTWLDTVSGALYFVPVARQVNTVAPLHGGGVLSDDLNLTIDQFSDVLSGYVPASGGGTSKFLRADGTWIAPPGSAIFTPTTSGTVPASGGGTATYLRADGTWAIPGGGGGGYDGGPVTNPILTPDGTEALPAYGFSAAAGLGLFAASASNQLRFTSQGVERVRFGPNTMLLHNAMQVSWADGPLVSGVLDLSIKRMSTSLLGVLGLGTGNAAMRIFGDGSTGLKYAQLQHDGTDTVLLTQGGVIRLKGGNVYADGVYASVPGAAASPTYGFAGLAGLGMHATTGSLRFAVGGVAKARLDSIYYILGSDVSLSFASGPNTEVDPADTFLKRAGSAGSIGIHNPSGPALLSVSGDGGVGAKYIQIIHDSTTPKITANTAIAFTKAYYSNKVYAGGITGTYDVNWALTNCHDINVNAPTVTFTFSGAVAGGRYLLCLKPTGGALTVTWPATVKWAGGTAPSAMTNGKTHLVAFFYDGANYMGTTALDF